MSSCAAKMRKGGERQKQEGYGGARLTHGVRFLHHGLRRRAADLRIVHGVTFGGERDELREHGVGVHIGAHDELWRRGGGWRG